MRIPTFANQHPSPRAELRPWKDAELQPAGEGRARHRHEAPRHARLRPRRRGRWKHLAAWPWRVLMDSKQAGRLPLSQG